MINTNRLMELEALISNIVGGVQVCKHDEDFTITYVNDGFAILTGYSMEEMTKIFKNKHAALVLPDDLDTIKTKITDQLSKDNRFTVEYRIKRKDGSVIWVLDKGVLVKPENCEPMIQCIITDITEQKEKEEAFMVSERRYEIAMEFSDVTMFDYNIVTKQMLLHRLDVEKFNFPKTMDNAVESFINSGFIQPGSVNEFRNLYKKIESGAPFADAIIYINDPMGFERVFEISLTNIFNKEGQPIRAVGVKKDITETLLLHREKEYGNTLVSNRLLTYEANVTKDKIINYNHKWASSLGLSDTDTFSGIVSSICKNAVASEHAEMFKHQLSQDTIITSFENGQRLITFDYLRKINGVEYRWFEKTINIIKNEFTGDVNIRCYIVDINARKEKEIKALEEQRLYEVMVSTPAVVYEVNITKNKFISGNEKWKELFGIENTDDDYSQMMLAFNENALHPEDRAGFNKLFLRENVLRSYENGNHVIHCEYRQPDETREFIWVNCTMHLFEDPQTGDIKGYSYIENIDKEKKKQLELIYRAEHDLLTGFYNKSTTEHLINDFLETSEAKICNHIFFIIDIDYFKSINDTFGHVFGDAVLSQMSDKMRLLFRDDDIIGRIGGDEFVVLMKNTQNNKIAISKAREICECMEETYTQNGNSYSISASVGIAFYNQHGKTYDELYKTSDSALYISKHNGRNQFTIYSTDMNILNSSQKEFTRSVFLEPKTFDKNIIEYVFRILYEASDKNNAINSVLELIGKHYKMSRAYIFEDSYDDKYTSNTFEWCNKGIAPQMSNLQNIPHADIDNYKDNFSSDGIFYMPEISKASPAVKELLSPQGVKSMLQFSIVKNGRFRGFIGFDECNYIRIPTKKELSDMRNIANILSVFVIEMRAIEENENTLNLAMSIVNGLDSYAYVCDPKSYEVLFINEKTLEIAPDAKIGDYCYKAFWNRTAPCDDCPMKNLTRCQGSKYSMELHNLNLDVWVKATASWINWLDSRTVCLIDSVDITEYKS